MLPIQICNMQLLVTSTVALDHKTRLVKVVDDDCHVVHACESDDRVVVGVLAVFGELLHWGRQDKESEK